MTVGFLEKKLKQEEFWETVLDLRRCSKNPEILRFSGWEYEPEYDWSKGNSFDACNLGLVNL